MGQWRRRKSVFIKYSVLVTLVCILQYTKASEHSKNITTLDQELIQYVDEIFNIDKYRILPGIEVERKENLPKKNVTYNSNNNNEKRSMTNDLQDYVYKRMDNYLKTHVVSLNLPETARFLVPWDTGKSSFMTGFGMGFMAFALKKLLLPVFIGAQIIKSVLIAMFLPSILGSLGKLVGKGLSSFSATSGASNGGGAVNHVEDFEFKDTSPYNNNDDLNQDINAEASFNNINALETTTTTIQHLQQQQQQEAMNRYGYGYGNNRISYVQPIRSDNYYIRQPNKKTDYKVFHKIPSSSLLLTSYDPFYSPLLSRLDAVFQQLGLGNGKSVETEKCRERLVCLMYANPAKYAPYSNLVSAQLSRELNELRKPSSDNPEILRFFRYMKAAKDGQDDENCLTHNGCPALSTKQPSPAMLTTFNDINKLVLARKLNR